MSVEPIGPCPNHEGEAAGIDVDCVAVNRLSVSERLDHRSLHAIDVKEEIAVVLGLVHPSRLALIAVEGDARAKDVALKIGRALGARPFVIRKESKVLYHAMGSFSSPMVVAALSLGEELGRVAGLSREEIRLVMAPIFSRTAENYLKKGTKGAFGGPINRGNIATVKKHLQDLKRVPEARAAYLPLARAAIKRLPVKNRKQLEELFRKA